MSSESQEQALPEWRACLATALVVLGLVIFYVGAGSLAGSEPTMLAVMAVAAPALLCLAIAAALVNA